jgi:hypothetical protein
VECIPYISKATELNKRWREFLGSHLREIMQILQIPRKEFDLERASLKRKLSIEAKNKVQNKLNN